MMMESFVNRYLEAFRWWDDGAFEIKAELGGGVVFSRRIVR
jgi:hypothetical protein